MYAIISKDRLHELYPADVPGHAGRTFGRIRHGDVLIPFRCLDDDREVYFEGKGTENSLEVVARWAMDDAGCTILQIHGPGGWRDEIG